MTQTFAKAGTVEWIGLRPATRLPTIVTEQVEAQPGEGLVGDRFTFKADGKRQVTLIQQEHLQAVARFLGIDKADPAIIRRNIVVSGVNLLALEGKKFRLGTALLEMTGPCEPCEKMEAALGPGGYTAMIGHGGITAKVLEAGVIRVGDSLVPVKGQ